MKAEESNPQTNLPTRKRTPKLQQEQARIKAVKAIQSIIEQAKKEGANPNFLALFDHIEPLTCLATDLDDRLKDIAPKEVWEIHIVRRIYRSLIPLSTLKAVFLVLHHKESLTEVGGKKLFELLLKEFSLPWRPEKRENR